MSLPCMRPPLHRRHASLQPLFRYGPPVTTAATAAAAAVAAAAPTVQQQQPSLVWRAPRLQLELR